MHHLDRTRAIPYLELKKFFQLGLYEGFPLIEEERAKKIVAAIDDATKACDEMIFITGQSGQGASIKALYDAKALLSALRRDVLLSAQS